MTQPCFFCDVQERGEDKLLIGENQHFFARYDEFPVSKGHALVVLKEHRGSLFSLTPEEVRNLHALLSEVREELEQEYAPDAYTIGINEGEAAGRTIPHLHVHLIPRYEGDVENPRGGVRNIFPEKGDPIPELEKLPEKQKYLE